MEIFVLQNSLLLIGGAMAFELLMGIQTGFDLVVMGAILVLAKLTAQALGLGDGLVWILFLAVIAVWLAKKVSRSRLQTFVDLLK